VAAAKKGRVIGLSQGVAYPTFPAVEIDFLSTGFPLFFLFRIYLVTTYTSSHLASFKLYSHSIILQNLMASEISLNIKSGEWTVRNY
jgi:hypothetical protein